MEWYVKKFDQLSGKEVYDILKARSSVFIVEQDCAYLDPDGRDETAIHIFAREDGKISAYCRVLPPGASFGEVSIGRVMTDEKYRRFGYGRELVRRALKYILSDMGEKIIRLSAQSYLERFYSSLGFKTVSGRYFEDGIPHIEMLYKG